MRYLWPYRRRIAVAIVCVLIVASLWAGGLGMMLPAAKILLAPEGLHGWAWKSMLDDRLGANVVQRLAPPGTTVTLPDPGTASPPDPASLTQDLSLVLDVVSIRQGDKPAPAAAAGVPEGQWIIGRQVDGRIEIVRGDALLRELARLPEGSSPALVFYQPMTRTLAVRPVRFGKLGLQARALGEAAMRIPEPKDTRDRFWLFAGVLVVLLVITFIRGFFTFLQEYLVGTAIWRGVMDMRCQNYNVVLHLPVTFFSEKGVSDATSRFIQDTNELARGQNTLLGKTMVEPAKAIASLTLALCLQWQLTLLTLVAGPPALFLIRRFGKKMHRASKRALESWSGMLSVLGETLLGIRVVKAYTMEGSERRRFFRVNRALLKQQNRMEKLDAATGPTVESLGIFFGMLAAAAAGYMVFIPNKHFTMDREVFLTWMAALFALFDPVRKLAKVTMRFSQADAAAQRIFELQDSPQERAAPAAPALPRHAQSLAFRDVSFRYPNAAVDALRNVNLTIRAGQTVAIVGPNGSGKTTLVSLLPRLLDPARGQVLIDGHDISTVSLRSLRRQIGLVTQETIIFHATVGENIAYGLRRPKQEAVLDASRKAFVDEFVRELPEGYDTLVGEHGSTLSGGQRQRIAIARAILRDPAILIFDEAMSQVDAHSEQRIHLAMKQFIRGRTALLIAHRLVTVLEAELIVVMSAGTIVDCGRHGELMNRCELYRQLAQSQLAGQAKAEPPVGTC